MNKTNDIPLVSVHFCKTRSGKLSTTVESYCEDPKELQDIFSHSDLKEMARKFMETQCLEKTALFSFWELRWMCTFFEYVRYFHNKKREYLGRSAFERF